MAIIPRQMLVSPNKYSIKCPNVMNPEYITVHNTANDAPAENEITYMNNNNNSVSYHFAVDDEEVVQGIPLNRNAWHCGDGRNGTGNRKSIGVEICYSRSGGERYTKAEQLTIKFIAQLLRERGWGIERVKKHEDWNGKYCPHRILSEGRWNSFLKSIEDELNNNNKNNKGDEDKLELSNYQWNVLEQNVESLLKEKVISDQSWVTKTKNKQLTLSELAWLNSVVLQRLR